MAQATAEKITVYGANWCGYTTRARQHLDSLGVQYAYVDVDEDPAASEWVKQHNGGKELKPTIDVAGDVLSNPSPNELDSALQRRGLLA